MLKHPSYNLESQSKQTENAVKPVWDQGDLSKSIWISSIAQQVLCKIIFIVADMEDHLSLETTKFSGSFIQVSL